MVTLCCTFVETKLEEIKFEPKAFEEFMFKLLLVGGVGVGWGGGRRRGGVASVS